MFFKTEQELVDTFSRVVSKKEKVTNLKWVHELESSNGIADIVLFQLRKDWDNDTNLKSIPPRWTFALRSLPYRKSFNLDYFCSFSRVSKSTAKNILKTYEFSGYCVKGKKENCWVKIKQPKIPTNKIIAIEAKLKDWKRAIKQAYRYQDFANESWVLMEEKHIKPAINNLARFRRLNIGLSSISFDGKIRVVNEPESRNPRSSISSWHANTRIAQTINAH